MLLIKEFLITEHGSIWPYGFQKQRLSPPWMHTDQVRIKSLALQMRSSLCDSLGSNHLRFCFHHEGMYIFSIAALE